MTSNRKSDPEGFIKDSSAPAPAQDWTYRDPVQAQAGVPVFLQRKQGEGFSSSPFFV